jgi:flavin reductase (DIM6/NTAB) family NADH-FMN oxidoreductase RutF
MPDINDILRLTDRELWLVTSVHEQRRGGLIATFVSSASIVPELPRMAVGIAKHHHTHGLIAASGAFRLHLLDETQIDLVWRFGLHSGHAIDKFALLPEIHAIAWMDCRVETTLDTGDRTLFLGEVVDSRLVRDAKPLTLQRLLALAPPDKLQALRSGMARDAEIDEAAIRAWRQER